MTTLTVPHTTPAGQRATLKALRAWHAAQPDFDELIIVEWGDTLQCSSTGPMYESMMAAVCQV